MNRLQTAVACVEALARQSRLPEMVVIADNGSSDGTVEQLESLADLPFRLVLVRMPENLGNAGGVKAAMELAFDEGADAVWILDDDSFPRSNALEELLKPEWKPMLVRHSLQVDPATEKFTWPLQVQVLGDGWQLMESMDQLPEGDLISTRIMWTGALISREVRKKIGPVMAELFIRGEDEEYPRRMEEFGVLQEGVRKAILDHVGPTNLVVWRVFGKRFFFEKSLADWKLYYKVRNMVWLTRRSSGTLKATLMLLVYSFAAWKYDGLSRLPLVWRAGIDGWCSVLGRWEKHP